MQVVIVAVNEKGPEREAPGQLCSVLLEEVYQPLVRMEFLFNPPR